LDVVNSLQKSNEKWGYKEGSTIWKIWKIWTRIRWRSIWLDDLPQWDI